MAVQIEVYMAKKIFFILASSVTVIHQLLNNHLTIGTILIQYQKVRTKLTQLKYLESN